MEEKLTVVQWLEEKLIGHLDISERYKKELFEQAKAMEKEQHQETWNAAHQAGRFEGKGIAEKDWQTFEGYWEDGKPDEATTFIY
jgi:hypothetical protein